MPHQVVISYSRRNSEIAEGLASALRERGVDFWYDRMIKPGADWRDEIANAISSAKIFVILFSADSNESQELRKELAIADRHKLLIVPVRVEEVEPRGLFEYELARRQWFDLFPRWRDALPAVVAHVADAAGLPPPQPQVFGTPRPPNPARPAFGTPLSSSHGAKQGEAVASTMQSDSLDLLRAPLVQWGALAALIALAILGLAAAVSPQSASFSTAGIYALGSGALSYLVAQPLLILFVAGDRTGRLTATSIACAYAILAVLPPLLHSTDLHQAAGGVGVLGGAAALIALGIEAIRGRKAVLFWLVPLLSSISIMATYGIAGGTYNMALFGGLGLFAGALFYAGAILRSLGLIKPKS